jgi:hypothetical protein
MLPLTATGTLIGVRAIEPNKTTGEISRFQLIDVYDAQHGAAEFRVPLDVALPSPGTPVELQVRVSAYSGFAKTTRGGEAVAGDARVTYTATAVSWVKKAAEKPAA